MNILVVDDSAVMRFGLVSLIRQALPECTIHEAEDGKEALELVNSEEIDLAFVDVRMPKVSGLQVLERKTGNFPIIMLTHSEEAAIIQAAMELGAAGYLVLGDITPEEISGVITTCLHGGMVLSKTAREQLLNRDDSTVDLRSQVSEREAQILDFVIKGKTNREIAQEIFLSERTVKNYLNASYKKLGVNSRDQAAIVWRNACKKNDLPNMIHS